MSEVNMTDYTKVFIDTEFSDSHKRDMNTICVSMRVERKDQLPHVMTYWTHDRNRDAIMYLKDDMQTLRDEGAVFFAYLASAECRALESVGIDTRELNWICLYSEWRQLNHNNERRMYGRYLRKGVSAGSGGLAYGVHGYSTPPSLVKEDNEGKDNTQVTNSYAAVAYHLLGKIVDSKRKDAMRDICIRGDIAEIAINKKEISEYCESDIEHLPAMWEKLAKEIAANFELSEENYFEIALARGTFAGPTTGRIEREGIPVDLDAIENLCSNVDAARDSLVSEYCSSVDHPFIERVKRTLKDFKAPWCDRYHLFETYVEGLGIEWRTTDSGRYSKDDDDLSEFDADPNIFYYRQVKKALKGLESFDPSSPSAKKRGLITDSIDQADQRLRVLFGIFGTMTGRNAPKARRFPFAMGRWARSFIRPPKGHVIIMRDWGSQEFMIAAALSGDENMKAAYVSGDPYMWFAIAAGAAPAGANKKTHGDVRTLFKSTTLGLQYGMGMAKLARKLTIDTGKPVTEKQAKKLIDLHRKIYRDYWRWAKKVVRSYKLDGHIVLADGWGLNSDCERETTVRNFPVQGTGAVILRRACNLAIAQGLPVIAPLHDAMYLCSPEEWADIHSEQLSACMQVAVEEVLGSDIVIRQDEERHDHTHTWIEYGAENVHKALQPFMEDYSDPIQDKANNLKTLLSATSVDAESI